MKAFPLMLLGAGLLAGCNSTPSSTTTDAAGTSAAALLTPGPWRGELAIQGQQLPFLFEVKTEGGKPVVYLINKGLNGEERLRCDEISAAGDSATIKLHVFDAALVVRADTTRDIAVPDSAVGAAPAQSTVHKSKLKGVWVKYDAKTPYRVPLVAEKGELLLPRYDEEQPSTAFDGTWKATFTEEQKASYPAVGILKELDKGEIRGTFLTTTGDYRYLSGYRENGRIKLSTFDGSHAFLFVGQAPEGRLHNSYTLGTLKGDFYAGKSGHEIWTATLDPKAKLPDADTLTYLKKGESRLNFKFPSVAEGGSISPTDAKYRGKVVVLQVLGSWCPNCMDETAFLAPWYAKNKARGVEVIGLGYERSSEYDKAAPRLRKLKERFDIGYDLAVAGVANKDSVARSLPQLAKFLAFPTTIFLDKKGAVRSIHTGFAGPGTGKYYEEEIAGFNRTVDKLLKE
ncbi:MAG TPA: TlpA disulfide reductase family protein [Hymenobacter sp.]|uniref:TlpA disulfide reductase family protein n=1 Tax=Hymenobacter sp. TaxID=1898978 RepID=UPI002D7E52FB|nr:TlpA disulfide reductase family protein [Hymenobacter sp.]HET9506276.1 TlpA disulfide reductase family protein [Hymenobacter sp.]